MNSRRGSTLSPIRMRNSSSAAPASSMLHLQQRAVGGVERRFAELFGVHFAEAFEAGDRAGPFRPLRGRRRGGRGGLRGRSRFRRGGACSASSSVPVRSCGISVVDVEAHRFAGRPACVLIVRTSCSSTMCSCGGVAVAVGRSAACGIGGCGGVGRRRPARRRLAASCCGDERVELLAGGEPVLLRCRGRRGRPAACRSPGLAARRAPAG